MPMSPDYDEIIMERADHVFRSMEKRVSPYDMQRIRAAFMLARKAHATQRRKTGEPYILHPIAVASIAADELMLGPDAVITAFLHDVVEDTSYTIEDIRTQFGNDVAFLVKVVTKTKKDHYDASRQVDNYKQILDSVQYDIRALLVKLADRLHNMRTLSSMRPDKQMKIAGETDYFYAPLANRLGFYHVKTELENLGFRFRCPHEYEEIARLIAMDESAQRERLGKFRSLIQQTLDEAGISVEVFTEYRKPYSVWRKMNKYGDDFNHLKYRHFTEVIFESREDISDKDMALKIYSILTDRFKEKPGGISNYIDIPKENGYQSFHVKLLADFGRWQEVHISSRRMVRDSQLGCIARRTDDKIERWIEKFKGVLRDISRGGQLGADYIEKVVTSFYNDDIMTFTSDGKEVVMPQKAIVLDFAYEVNPAMACHAKYARVNGFLSSIKARLRRGDVVEVFTSDECSPRQDWLDAVVTYKAKREIGACLASMPKPAYMRCQDCMPIPGEEVVGFKDRDDNIILHTRNCPIAVKLASQYGDAIVSVDFKADNTIYPVEVVVIAVDRYHLFIDLVDCITNTLHLTLDSFNTSTVDSIVECRISFGVHSYGELESVMNHISAIEGVDSVKWFRP